MIVTSLSFITGVNIGFEFIEDDEEDISYLIIDLLIIRIMIGKVND